MRSKRLLGAAAGVLALTGGGIALIQSGATEVASVRVQGAEVLNPVAVRRASGISPGMNALSLDLAAAEVRLERIPMVDAATVDREGALGVVITIVERRPAVIVATTVGRRALDRDGVAMPVPPAPITLPQLRVDRLEDLEQDTVRGFLRLWDRLTVAERRTAGVSWGAVRGLTIDFGPTAVVIGDGEAILAKLGAFRELRRTLGRAPRRVDLRQLPRIGVIG